MMYLPRTGKNLKPWKLPQVATYRPLAPEWGEMMKSELVVKASLSEKEKKLVYLNGEMCQVALRISTYQQMRCLSIFHVAPFLP